MKILENTNATEDVKEMIGRKGSSWIDSDNININFFRSKKIY